MSTYLTIQGHATAEIEEKKSRFIAQLSHVETEDEARGFLNTVRTKHRMARHNVYAYVLNNGQTNNNQSAPRLRYSDDGEPAKTAGLPILQTLQHAHLTNVIMVVTRYFGGTLLGTGGLVRAYTTAAQAAISQATIVTITSCVDITITLPYALNDAVVHLIAQSNGKILDTVYTDTVCITCRMVDGDQQPLLQALQELFKGEAPYAVSEPAPRAF